MNLTQSQYNYNPGYPSGNSQTSSSGGNSGIVIYIILGALLLFLAIVACSMPRNTSNCLLNMFECFYKRCFCRLDCTSKLTSNEAIMRYTEEPPLDSDEFVNRVISDEYIKSILNSLAVQLPEYFLSILPTGSLREGFGKILPSTSILASDFDIMLIPDAALAGDATKIYKGNERPLFATVESKEIEEGFLWLRLENEYMTQWKDLCIRRQTEGQGCSYLSSHRVHDMIRKTFLKGDALLRTNEKLTGILAGANIQIEQNGPALTIKVIAGSLRAAGMKCCKQLCKSCENDNRDDFIFYCDFTFSLHCPQWPDKSNWFSPERRRQWPPQGVVDQVMDVGCHVVPKPSTDSIVKLHIDQPTNTTYSQSPGLEWRYSFSQPEILLAAEVPEEAKSAYLALKAVNKRYFSEGLTKALSSYAMKCVLLQMMEDTEAEFWEHNYEPIDVFMKMLDILYQHLSNRAFPHYWIPSINLAKDLNTEAFDQLCQKINTVRNKPQAFIADNWLEHTRCLRLNCCSCCVFGKCNLRPPITKGVTCCSSEPSCLIPCTYSKTTWCFGPCPYNRVTMDVY